MKYKLSLPGAYTLLIRLAGLRAVAIYLYTNFVVPVLLTLAMRGSLGKEMLAELLGSWILIHLVYEIGYFMNDFFAADVRNNWRKIPSLDSKSTNVSLADIRTVLNKESLSGISLRILLIGNFL